MLRYRILHVSLTIKPGIQESRTFGWPGALRVSFEF